jgi:kynurenine formamidase
MRHRAPILLLLAALSCRQAEAPAPDWSAVFDGRAGTWIDLSYAYSDETLYWPTADGFRLDVVADGYTEAGYYYASNNFTTSEHGGTHLDAPIHFAEGRQASSEIPLSRLIGPAVVIDVSERAGPDYQVGVQDLQGWEAAHGPLADGVILLIRTGWGDRWPDAGAYLGTERRGAEAVAELHFPGLASEAAQWLVDNRSIGALGIDTPSIDYGQSTLFETHRILYDRDIPGFENVANLGGMPETGGYVVALPMKIEGGSGGPLRIVGFVPS